MTGDEYSDVIKSLIKLHDLGEGHCGGPNVCLLCADDEECDEWIARMREV